MPLLWISLYCFALLALAVISLVQLLYLESLRLRARDFPALEFFKEQIEPSLDLETDYAALVFTIYKHSLLVVVGVLALLVNSPDGVMQPWAVGQALLIALPAMTVFSYLWPQLMYRRSEGTFLKALVPLLKLLAVLIRPIAALLGFVETLAEISQPSENLEEGASPQEEIEALIAAGEEEGLIEEGDKKLIQSVVAFGDKRVREVMTPRPNIVSIDGNRSVEELRRLVINEKFSRVPVFDGDIDHITGFIHVRDMFEVEDEDRDSMKVKEIQRPIVFVPETKLVTDLMREMQRDGTQIAVVVDEYGTTAGLASMEDLVEEVFGEIRDEHEPGHDVTTESDGSFTVAGSFDVDHLRDLVEFTPPEDLEATTVGGLATEWFGRVPEPGEVIEREGVRIEVIASDDRRVERVRISRLAAADAEEDHVSPEEQ
jgi:putative hemolysin